MCYEVITLYLNGNVGSLSECPDEHFVTFFKIGWRNSLQMDLATFGVFSEVAFNKPSVLTFTDGVLIVHRLVF